MRHGIWRAGINAQLCSSTSSCRNAGISNYIRSLVTQMGLLDDGSVEKHLFLSPANQEDFPSELRRHYSRFSTDNPFVRILWEQMLLPGIIKKLHLDLLHSPMHILPSVCGCRSVVTILDLSFIKYPETFNAAKRRYLTVFTRQALKKADGIIAISESTKRDVIRLFSVHPDSVRVTHLAADKRFHLVQDSVRIEEVRNRYGLGGRSVLCLGTLEPRKNLPNLIRAFQSVSAREPEARLVIAGGDGWLYEDIYRLIERLDIKDRVRRTGYVAAEDLPALYSCADVFVYPSLYEGFGLPPLEAMACGTPVITSNTSSLPEVVGDAGVMVDPLNVDELADAMLRVLAKPDLRQEMREKGLARAKLFSWEETARQTLNVYKEVLQQSEVMTSGVEQGAHRSGRES